MFALVAWIVVGLHLLFALLESVGWDRLARSAGYTAEQTETTRVLALNQGAYNAGLAVLLAWALVTGRDPTAVALLWMIVAMAVVGALSARWTILLVQGGPALLALGCWFLA